MTLLQELCRTQSPWWTARSNSWTRLTACPEALLTKHCRIWGKDQCKEGPSYYNDSEKNMGLAFKEL